MHDDAEHADSIVSFVQTSASIAGRCQEEPQADNFQPRSCPEDAQKATYGWVFFLVVVCVVCVCCVFCVCFFVFLVTRACTERFLGAQKQGSKKARKQGSKKARKQVSNVPVTPLTGKDEVLHFLFESRRCDGPKA